ncbi:uncharacterized protein LOC111374387 [Olea europaea var. sylvestris]|uniref:uncharacterized protein LOC111374387 n=1 Tax=Olea europaea var. sylvestris TaxID=158386 RepID=UPI000C1CF7CD|nr:uncharacterized protein LOC111374387 [Olea europaea var. sylvestris]
MANFRALSKCIPNEKTFFKSAWIFRWFVSATRPSHNAAKIDKETCGKVIEAAESVKDGTQEVVQEVKRVGKVVTDKIAKTAGTVIANAANKGLEKAAETADTKKGKDVWDTAKVATEVFKDKLDDKKE